jgi:hypothetical protein
MIRIEDGEILDVNKIASFNLRSSKNIKELKCKLVKKKQEKT